MKASLFYLPSIGSRAEIEQGMAGMNPDFYQRMLKELTEQIRLGDELGYDSVSFTEHHFRIVKKCWTEEMLTYDGKFWKVPAGPTPWTLDTTAKWGKGVENGILTSVGVVPKPLQKPHPPLFQPFASSENTVRFCAQES